MLHFVFWVKGCSCYRRPERLVICFLSLMWIMFSSVFMTWDRSLLSSNQHEETLFYRVIYWWSTGLPPAQREVLGGSCPSSCCRLWITQGSALNSWTDRCVQHYYYRNNQNTCSVVTAFSSACFLTHQNTATFNMLVQPWRYLSLVVQFNCRPGIQSSSVYIQYNSTSSVPDRIHTWECFLFIVPPTVKWKLALI